MYHWVVTLLRSGMNSSCQAAPTSRASMRHFKRKRSEINCRTVGPRDACLCPHACLGFAVHVPLLALDVARVFTFPSLCSFAFI